MAIKFNVSNKSLSAVKTVASNYLQAGKYEIIEIIVKEKDDDPEKLYSVLKLKSLSTNEIKELWVSSICKGKIDSTGDLHLPNGSFDIKVRQALSMAQDDSVLVGTLHKIVLCKRDHSYKTYNYAGKPVEKKLVELDLVDDAQQNPNTSTF